MRAMRLKAPAKIATAPLRSIELPDVEPGEGEIAIDVKACGVCRTNLQIAEGDLAARALPIVPGHQIVGRVASVGRGVTAWRVGERVGAAWLAGTDGTCRQCRAARENLCARRDVHRVGSRRRIRDAIAIRPRRLRAVNPRGVRRRARRAAPLRRRHRVRALKRARVEPRDRASASSASARARSSRSQVARHWGCRVFVCTRSAAEQERARALGAEWAGDYDTPPPEPLDSAVTFAPAGVRGHRALRALNRGGVVAINAIHLDELPAMPYGDLWWEREIRSVANFTRDDAREFLALAAAIPVRTEFEVHPLADANVALARLARGEVKGAAVLAT